MAAMFGFILYSPHVFENTPVDVLFCFAAGAITVWAFLTCPLRHWPAKILALLQLIVVWVLIVSVFAGLILFP
jgi:hypothetical protein